MITEFHKIPIQSKCKSVQSCLFYGSNTEFMEHIESSLILHVNSMLAKWNSPDKISTQANNHQNNNNNSNTSFDNNSSSNPNTNSMSSSNPNSNGNSIKIYDEETFIQNYQEILSPGLFNYDFSPKYIIIKEITSDKHLQIYKKILENEIAGCTSGGAIEGVNGGIFRENFLFNNQGNNQENKKQNYKASEQENDKEICRIFCFSTKLRSTSKIVQLFNKEKSLNSVKSYDVTYQQKEKMIMNEINAMVQLDSKIHTIGPSDSTSSTDMILSIKTFLMQLPINTIMNEISKLNILYEDTHILKKYLSNYKLQKDDTNIELNFPYEFSNGRVDTMKYVKNAEPISIVRILLNHFLKLLEAKELLQNGKNISQIPQILGIFFKNQDIFKKQMMSYTNIHIVEIMKMLNDVEIKCKMNNTNMGKEYMFMRILQYIQSAIRV